jgi:hypothetical protein
MEDILAITFIFGGGSIFLLAISPIGRAVADRIRGQGGGGGEALRQLQESQEVLGEELEVVRRELVDLQERLDFAERLLARGRDSGSVPGAEDVQK